MSAATVKPALGCKDPDLGVEARRALGRELPRKLHEHLGTCLACQLERLAFERFAASDEPHTR